MDNMDRNKRKRRRDNNVWSRLERNPPVDPSWTPTFFGEDDSVDEPPRSRRRLNEDYDYHHDVRARDGSYSISFGGDQWPSASEHLFDEWRPHQASEDLRSHLNGRSYPPFSRTDLRSRIGSQHGRSQGDGRATPSQYPEERGGHPMRRCHPDPATTDIRVVMDTQPEGNIHMRGRSMDRHGRRVEIQNQQRQVEALSRGRESISRDRSPGRGDGPSTSSREQRSFPALLLRDDQATPQSPVSQGPSFLGQHKKQATADVSHFQRELSKLRRSNPDAIAAFLGSSIEDLVEYITFSKNPESVIEVVSLLSKMASRDCCPGNKRNVYKALVKLNPFDGDQVIAKLKESLSRARTTQRVPNFDVTLMKELASVVVDAMKSKAYSAEEANTLKSVYLIRDILRRCTSQPEGDFGSLQSLLENLDEAATKTPETAAQSIDLNDFEILPGSDDFLLDRLIDLAPHNPKEPFSSSTDYLKYMFRTFREDFVTPLCNGVKEYAQRRRLGQPPQNERLKDVRAFRGVTFHSMEPVKRSGIVWTIKLDMANTRRRLISSGAFKHGSLLCLSMNDFETLFFAEVIEVNAASFRQGKFGIRVLDESIRDDVGLLLNNMFVVLESTAFFTAYNFTLQSLKSMAKAVKEDGESIPMARYLVECQSTPNPPSFLGKDTKVNLLCLRSALSVASALPAFEEEPTDGNRDIWGILGPIHDEFGRWKFPVLQEELWPTCESLGLDASQKEALRLALCGELALVQGPPGTGKTTLGVKLARVLLANCDLWNKVAQTSRPMLLLSYTNHALDQFLQLLLQTPEMRRPRTTDIVRVGSGCDVQALQRFTLKEHRKAQGFTSAEARRSLWQCREAAQKFVIDSSAFEQLQSGLAHEEELRQACMLLRHYDSLILRRLPARPLNKTAMVAWLCLRHMARQAQQNPRPGNKDDDDELFEDNLEENNRRMVDGFDDDHMRENDHLEEGIALGMAVDGTIVYEPSGDRFWDAIELQERHRILHIIQEQKSSNDKMSEEEERTVKDLWTLPLEQRWRLYRLWHWRLMVRLGRNLGPAIQKVTETTERLAEVDAMRDLAILSQAKVVAMTTTGAARCSELLRLLAPPVVLVEEAAEIPEQHVLAALTPHCRHLVLIGDHCQLRPKPNAHALARTYHTDVSMFERLVRAGVRHCMLNVQHRMRPEISSLMVPHFYPQLQDHSSVMAHPHVRGVREDMFFLDHSHVETKREGSTSLCNQFEADFITRLYRYLRLQGYKASDITILATYMDQVRLVRKSVATLESEDPLLQQARASSNFAFSSTRKESGVRVTSVDNFQGEENKIILLSLVRSNAERSIGHLAAPNRMCVALSRAREGMFVVGNFSLLRRCSDVWKDLCLAAKDRHQLGHSLPLVCVRHKDNVTEVSSVEDFKKVPDGGCLMPCDFRRPCGHACERSCHQDDLDHEVPCPKPCLKTCSEGHPCPIPCGKKCDPCKQGVPKTLPSCGHTQLVPCHKDVIFFMCQENCSEILPCGHKCQAKCSEDCDARRCEKLVMLEKDCGHNVRVPCKDKDGDCEVPCEATLDCGHRCRGTCGTCFQGRLHMACKKKCERILVCGHTCSAECCETCPPCRKTCPRQCNHSKCQMKCGDPCVPCTEPCTWSCLPGCADAHKCSSRCGESCKRPRCSQPCRRKLKCKHPCRGLHCEECPPCPLCESSMRDIFFGSEDEPDALFYTLPDCKHSFEVTGLDTYMSSSPAAGSIGSKTCPRCKCPISTASRYWDVIQAANAEIDEVKRKMIEAHTEVKKKLPGLENKMFILCRQISGNSFRSILDSAKVKLFDHWQRRATKTVGHCVAVENQINFYGSLEKVYAKASGLPSLTISDETLKENTTGAKNLQKNLKRLAEWTLAPRYFMSHQSLQEFQVEFKRVQLITDFLLLEHSMLTSFHDTATAEDLKAVRNTLGVLDLKKSDKPTDAAMSKAREQLESLLKTYPPSGLGVSEEERLQIVQAMGFSQKGHWFKCPKGHVYAIGDCGGAMEESNCPECGAAIGGGNHSLLGDNSLASEMDNAQFPAWSEQANLLNYDIGV